MSEVEIENLQDIANILSIIEDEYEEADANINDRIALQVASHVIYNIKQPYLFKPDEEPTVCPRCANEISETECYENWNEESIPPERLEAFYTCNFCGFHWHEIYRKNQFEIWKDASFGGIEKSPLKLILEG